MFQRVEVENGADSFLLQGGTINSSLIQCKLLVGKQTENFNLITNTHEGHFYSRIKL